MIRDRNLDTHISKVFVRWAMKKKAKKLLEKTRRDMEEVEKHCKFRKNRQTFYLFICFKC